MKKFSVLMIVISLFLFTAISVYSDNSGSINNISWSFEESTGVLTITGTGDIPDYTSNRNLPWYSHLTAIKSVNIGEGISGIGARAFYGCTRLEKAVLPESVLFIDNYSFNNCKALTQINIGENVSQIGDRAFYNCTSLKEIVLSENTTVVGSSAFAKCTSLSSVELGGVIELGDSVFEDCENLNSIEIPASVEFFGEEIFLNCNPELEISVFYNSPACEYFEMWEYNYVIYCQLNYYSNEELLSVQKCRYNDKFTLPNAPDPVEGYDFLGWKTGENTFAPGEEIIATDNLDIYANWSLKTYLVTFSGEGADNVPKPQTKSYFDNLIICDTIPVKDGFNFMGWAIDTDKNSVIYKPGDCFTENKDITLYAVWEEKTYTVSYDANGGTGDFAALVKKHLTPLQLTDEQPVRSGYTFKGWSKNKEAVIKDYSPGELMTENGDITLYAVWSEGIIIGDVNNDGEVTMHDLLIAIKRLNGYNEELSADSINAMDTFSDTYFNIKDVVKMTQSLAGWTNVVLGE